MFPLSEDSEVPVIVYGELGTRSWLSMHNTAKTLARNGKAKYVFRHWIKVAISAMKAFQFLAIPKS